MYSFEKYRQITLENNNMIMPTMQNDQCDPTTATTSTASSDQRENTSQSDHQFRRPNVPPPLRYYRHPAKALKCDHSNALTTSTYVVGGVVNGTGNTGGVVVGDQDLGGGYVYADEDIWDCGEC
ncbi:uncharacterized protein LOC113554702 [Rhopalosiphum maidis]|uniref:uncharacterized protein LOC113554702 n=1 Tax=Rhopalosiphum maidis TaxID=43146 RepID=UPI000EFDD2C9|nr:uncharacterized protein LOC113554702 [Rhopalosiphum maidis]